MTLTVFFFSKHTSEIVLMVQTRLKKVYSIALTVEFTITVLHSFLCVSNNDSDVTQNLVCLTAFSGG